MTRTRWSIAAVCLLLGMNVVTASESDELRARAGQLKRNAAEFKERGESAVAARLVQEAMELSERAEVLSQIEKQDSSQPKLRERQLQRLHARLTDLRVANRQLWAADASEEELLDLRRQIRNVEALIAEKEAPSSPQDRLHHVEGLLHRIEHLRHAAEHLQAADMPEMARALREKSLQMERAARNLLEHLEEQTDAAAVAPAPLPEAPAPHPPVVTSPTKSTEEALRDEIQSLRREVEKLREQRQP